MLLAAAQLTDEVHGQENGMKSLDRNLLEPILLYNQLLHPLSVMDYTTMLYIIITMFNSSLKVIHFYYISLFCVFIIVAFGFFCQAFSPPERPGWLRISL